MTPLEEQFELLRRSAQQATLTKLASGAAIIAVPDIELPSGWSARSTTVRFLAPTGYPFAKPDCFWVDHDLRLANGAMPASTGIQAIPETSEQLLWFSWHLGQWNPNKDTLATYFFVVKTRLQDVR